MDPMPELPSCGPEMKLQDSQDVRFCTRCGWWKHTLRNCKSPFNRNKTNLSKKGSYNFCGRCGLTGHRTHECDREKNYHGHQIIAPWTDFVKNNHPIPENETDAHEQNLQLR